MIIGEAVPKKLVWKTKQAFLLYSIIILILTLMVVSYWYIIVGGALRCLL